MEILGSVSVFVGLEAVHSSCPICLADRLPVCAHVHVSLAPARRLLARPGL